MLVLMKIFMLNLWQETYDCWVIMIVVPIVNMGCERHEEMKYKEENKKIL